MKKKVNLNRPEISSEEIAGRKNFDSVLKNTPQVSGKPLLKKPWFLSSVIVATIAIVTGIVLMNKSTNQQPTTISQQAVASDSLILAAFYKNEEAKPCIHPPIDGLNIPYTIYKVNSEKGGTLDFKTGSKLTVPENAFTDETGKILKGEVELRYREFHDAADFFVSGIPMTYDSGGVRYQFESAGMMEMLAYQNGKPVNMAPGKLINVELASSYKGNEYNLYKLDTVKNNWACLGKDKVTKEASNYNKNVEKGSNDFETEGGVDVMKKIPEYKTIETKKTELQKDKETEIAILPKPLPEPKKPDQVKKGKYTFNIDVDAKEYPELAVYKGLLFEVGDENKNFNKSMYDITWDEAIIKDGEKKGENYLLTLKKGVKNYQLVVYPVYEGRNYEAALKTYQDKFNKYTLTLDKRKADEKRIEEDYQAKLIALKNQQEELMRKEKAKEVDLFKKMDTEAKVIRVFTISSFGVYNSDCPHLYPKGIMCTASLKSDQDRNLQCYETYLVDKQRNGLFTYVRNPITKFSFDPRSVNMLWTVESGVLYWLKPDDFKTIKNSEDMSNLKLTRVEQKFDNVDELKAYFNF